VVEHVTDGEWRLGVVGGVGPGARSLLSDGDIGRDAPAAEEVEHRATGGGNGELSVAFGPDPSHVLLGREDLADDDPPMLLPASVLDDAWPDLVGEDVRGVDKLTCPFQPVLLDVSER
jgi:hypothetical protein